MDGWEILMRNSFVPATQEERKIYYEEEWSKKDLPDFIVTSIEQREFGFDHDGSGPNDRYREMNSAEQLEIFLKNRCPYAAYSSISFYEKPYKREGWLKAELVFDIDAKDLPARQCECKPGNVCEDCLEDSKQYALLISDALKGDLNLHEIRYIYSGRGYHIRIFDDWVMKTESIIRENILDYASGGVFSKDKPDYIYGGATTFMDMLRLTKRSYPRIFKERINSFLGSTIEEKLKNMLDIGEKSAKEIFKQRRIIANEIEEGRSKTLEKILGKKKYVGFFEDIRRYNAGMLDAKVTVDVKRILRLPSSLHSTVSMKCMEVKNIEKFDPLSDAVPKFVRERK